MSSNNFLQQIQNQEQIVEELHPSTRSFFNQMISSKREPLVEKFLTVSSVKQRFWKWRESTSTSPSGLHLGHWRTIVMDYNLENSPTEDAEICEIQETILSARVSLLNYAIKWNYSFRRWQKIVTLMILKEVGM